jgi:hypothetical protein
MLAAMISGLNLGYRLILPVLPFALMIAGQGCQALLTGIIEPRSHGGTPKSLNKAPWLRVSVVSLLLSWLVFDSLSIAPDHLAYFNQLVYRDRDYEVLVDSNLDWGQDLIALREWQRAHHVTDLNLAYFGTAPGSLRRFRQTAAKFFAERFWPRGRWLQRRCFAAGTLRHQRDEPAIGHALQSLEMV